MQGFFIETVCEIPSIILNKITYQENMFWMVQRQNIQQKVSFEQFWDGFTTTLTNIMVIVMVVVMHLYSVNSAKLKDTVQHS